MNDLALLRGAAPAAPVSPRELVGLFLAGRKPTTLRTYAAALRAFALWRGAPEVAAACETFLALGHDGANAVALAWRATLVESGASPSTVNLRLSALRALVSLGRLLGVVGWTLDVPGVRGETLRDTRGCGSDGVRAILATTRADTSPRGVRDYAIVRLLADLALRRSEVAGLDVEHVDLAGARVAVRGKGRAEREWLTLPGPTVDALRAWLYARGADAGPLFHASGRATRLDGSSLWRVVRARGRAAGFPNVRPHGFRHAAITAALDATGGDVRAAQRFSRHSDVRTLQRYDDARRDDAGRIASTLAAAW